MSNTAAYYVSSTFGLDEILSTKSAFQMRSQNVHTHPHMRAGYPGFAPVRPACGFLWPRQPRA
eukprot:scaffold313897_cov12-Tisochrysis_lutea.AAC.1